MSIGHSPAATGFWVQRGGMAENKQENIDGYLYLGREGGNAFVYVGNGGKFRFPNVNVVGFGGPGSNGGSGVITVDGVDSLVDFGTRPVCWMWHTNYTTHININNGGKFRAYRFQYEALRSRLENSRSYLSFDGGELSFARQKAETKEYAAFMTWYANDGIPRESHPDLCTVFAGGAVIRVEDDFTVHWEADLLKPSGKSVTAIALPSDESFYAATHLGALRVVIEDSAGGEGASAFVDYDCKTRLPSKIIVTSPGVNYSPETVTAKVKSMRGDVEWDCAVTLGEIVGGGLEKAGPGLLTLKGTSTYSGRTKVSGGRLAICREAFPQNQPLELAGGTLVMSSYDLSVSDISGYGSVISQESVTRMHIGGKMVISAEDAIDGSMLEFVKVKPVFEEGASIEISGTLPDMDGECRCVLAKFSHPFEGDPVLKNTRDGWKMYLSGDRKSLKLRRLCGFTMIVR
jgi:autotransporter-associated beta strand protein